MSPRSHRRSYAGSHSKLGPRAAMPATPYRKPSAAKKRRRPPSRGSRQGLGLQLLDLLLRDRAAVEQRLGPLDLPRAAPAAARGDRADMLVELRLGGRD